MRFDWRAGSRNIKGELRNWIIQYQGMAGAALPVIVGLTDPANRELRDSEFLYADHAYFRRGWNNNNFRLIRSAHHLTHVLKRPADRLKKWGVQIEPWRKGGRSIVVIPPSSYYAPIYDDRVRCWLQGIVGKIAKHTDRPIHVKESKGRLRECLLEEQDAFAVVCCISVAGMEAALMGVPVFSTPLCCSWPINAGPIEKIESPEYPERFEWACSLAYASWNADEFETIDFRDYQYECLPSPPATERASSSTAAEPLPA